MGKLALLFPGQGAQYLGMGRDFYGHYPIFRETFEEASDLVGENLARLVFEGPLSELTLTKHAQIAIFITSFALWRTVESQLSDLQYDVVAGLSLGEYTALAVSRKLAFPQAVKLVHARGNLMHEASLKAPGTLAVVLGLDPETIETVIRGTQCWIANLNCPGQVVISGSMEGIASASAALKECGAKRILPLDVSGAFHSPLMQSALDGLAPKIHETTFYNTKTQIVMNVPGDFVEDLEEMKTYLIRQVAAPTYWEKGIHKMMERGVTEALEIGPGKTLSGMNKKMGLATTNIEKLEDVDVFAQR